MRRERPGAPNFVRVRATLPSGTEVEIANPGSSESGGPVMGLVIVPDIFGLRPLFDDLTSRLAREWRMTVCAVEPFPGCRLGTTLEERAAAMPTLDDDVLLRDLEHAADMTGHERVGVMGFCMGGMYTMKAARSDRFVRFVSFYGMVRVPAAWRSPTQRDALDYVASGHADRVLAFIGGKDSYTPADEVAELEATGATVVRYPDADHGFAHDAARPAHRADDAADAFARAEAWMKG